MVFARLAEKREWAWGKSSRVKSAGGRMGRDSIGFSGSFLIGYIAEVELNLIQRKS